MTNFFQRTSCSSYRLYVNIQEKKVKTCKRAVKCYHYNYMEQDKIQHLRHSLAHLLAAAVLKLYPDAQPTLGPAVDDGFYYDFGNLKISEDDLPKIEAEMKKILPIWDKFERHEIKPAEAKEFFKNNSYKLELIDEIEKTDEPITFYKSGPPAGEFTDLCRGGHIESAKDINSSAFKLSRIAGAYWRGDEKNPMLTRIYGLAFKTKKELEEYEKMVKEAQKRDHRKLGKELDLFTFSGLIGSGLPLYTPRGAFIRRSLNDYIELLQSKIGYTQVWTPQIAKADLFKISGHYDKYKDGMFRVISNYSKEEFYLKPMSCPQHTQIYASKTRSYRDLPLRYTDFAMLYRDEKPGELNGLARVRSFSQDDCHIFCREDQVDKEIDDMLNMIKEVMKTFDLKYKYRLSTRDLKRPEKYVGDPKVWDRVEKWTEEIMKRNNIEYFDGPGEAAFYAPKMDLIATDALGREWQLSTIQIDFVMPQKFSLVYTDKDGKEKSPVMLHRAIIGSPERFIMILIEHYAGAFPLWLAPVQAQVLSVSEKYTSYAREIYEKLREVGIRAELDDGDDALGKKIRNGKLAKIPYLLVLGEKEKSTQTLTAEGREGEKLAGIPLVKFLETISQKIKNRN